MIIPDFEALARDFWVGTDGHDTFPREIEDAAPLKLPLVIVKQTAINAQVARSWLQQRWIGVQLPYDRRDLYGCLVAHRGYGFIFVNETDSPEEQRLTIAHEVAHFIADYRLPREQVIQALGSQMLEVLDGVRPPTPAERAAAILSHVHLGAHVHLLPRPGRAGDDEMQIAHAEDRADRLAIELVAPLVRVREVLDTLAARQPFIPEAAHITLAAYFGLPSYVFHDITQRMVRCSPPSFMEDILAGLRQQR